MNSKSEPEYTDEPSEKHLSQQVGGWVDALEYVSIHFQLSVSPENLRVKARWITGQCDEKELRKLAQHSGLKMRFIEPDLTVINSWRLPVALELTDGQVAVITGVQADQMTLIFSGDQGTETLVAMNTLQASVRRLAVLRPMDIPADARIDSYLEPVKKHWIRDIVFSDRKSYGYIFLASIITNVMALGGVLFSMQVYDRVIPAQSEPTLYVLFGGVLLSIVFAWVMRSARTRITDLLGKKADLRISDRVFDHALRIRSSARPQSTGAFISQLKELESVRDMMTSTTIAAVADLPFFILFSLVFWSIAGWLVVVPLLAFVALLLPGILLQPKLRELVRAGMRESSLRNAMLVETVQGMEDIKILQAEPRFLNKWNYYNTVNADAGLKLRDLLSKLNNWIQTVQGSTFAVVVFLGAPHVIAGQMTTGVLVAGSILSSRMLAPLSGIAQLLNRWQQAKMAGTALDKLMKMPIDNPENSTRVSRPSLSGNYEIRDAVFGYHPENPVLNVARLDIRQGERIALLGRNGAGKSTLLQVLAGLIEPFSGKVILDGVTLSHLDPADVRRDVSFLTQNARLFYGTIRENLLLGYPQGTDAELIAALKAAGAWEFISHLQDGWDHVVAEGGGGLSGGQRQSLLLARLLLRNPSTLLLDEPTASLDEIAEKRVMQQLKAMSGSCTLVIATHRPAVLQIVDRILVIDNGKIVLDGPRDEVLSRLSGTPTPSAGERK